jgi:hypothetical protein
MSTPLPIQRAASVPQVTHFNDLGFSLVESPHASSAALYRHDNGRIFAVPWKSGQLIAEVGRGASREEFERKCRALGADPTMIERLLGAPGAVPEGAAPSFYSLIPVTRPHTIALVLGHLNHGFPEKVKLLGEQIRRGGELQGTVTVTASGRTPADLAAWCTELKTLRKIVDAVQLSTDADLRLVLRAHAGFCPDLAAVASVVDHLSAELTEHDEFAPLADLGEGWKSISIRLRGERIQDVPTMLRMWRDEGVRFFELPLSLASAIYPELHHELLPAPERRAILVNHYCLIFARLLRREGVMVPGKEPAEHCAGGSPCWARRLCPAYPGGDAHCQQWTQLASMAIGDFETITGQLKQYIYGFTHGQRLEHVMDFIGNLSDAISLGWETD